MVRDDAGVEEGAAALGFVEGVSGFLGYVAVFVGLPTVKHYSEGFGFQIIMMGYDVWTPWRGWHFHG